MQWYKVTAAADGFQVLHEQCAVRRNREHAFSEGSRSGSNGDSGDF